MVGSKINATEPASVCARSKRVAVLIAVALAERLRLR
jgi:hypothetical protein